MLQGTQLLASVAGYKQFAEQEWERIAPALPQSPAYTWEAFLWAFGTVRGRAHAPLEVRAESARCSLLCCYALLVVGWWGPGGSRPRLPHAQGGKIALVPTADLLVHARDGNCKWEVRGGGGGLFGVGDEALVVTSTRDVQEGELLTMDYGPGQTDSKVALDYGVVDAEDRRPGFALTLELPDGSDYFDDKVDILEINGLGQQATFALRREQGGARLATSAPRGAWGCSRRRDVISSLSAFLSQGQGRPSGRDARVPAPAEPPRRRCLPFGGPLPQRRVEGAPGAARERGERGHGVRVHARGVSRGRRGVWGVHGGGQEGLQGCPGRVQVKLVVLGCLITGCIPLMGQEVRGCWHLQGSAR